MTNLRNYVNFSMSSASPVQLGSVKLLPTGQGSGMLGLPGDFTPPSLFVRAVAFSQSVFTPKTGGTPCLRRFTSSTGSIFRKVRLAIARMVARVYVLADYTIWTAASDLKAKRYYFRT